METSLQAEVSFAGEAKPFYFAENAEKFLKYLDKIEYVVVRELPPELIDG